MENNNSLVWEDVSLKEPQMTVSTYIYFNSSMRDIFVEFNSIGIDLFKTEIDGKTILSLRPGNQFLFIRKKNSKEKRIVCNDLSNYIASMYGGKSNFKLILNDGYYILSPIN